jgi:hypothetical protein
MRYGISLSGEKENAARCETGGMLQPKLENEMKKMLVPKAEPGRLRASWTRSGVAQPLPKDAARGSQWPQASRQIAAPRL